MTYTDDVSRYRCSDCVYYDPLAGYLHENKCKRIDHKTVKFAVPWFHSYDAGRSHCICCDFYPNPIYIEKYIEWHGYENFWEYWKLFVEQWHPSWTPKNQYIGFTLYNNTDVRYYVKLKKFLNGTMIKNGVLMCDFKKYYKRHKKKHDLDYPYELVKEMTPKGVEISKLKAR